MNIFAQQNKMNADIGLVLVVLVDTRALAGRVTARSKEMFASVKTASCDCHESFRTCWHETVAS